MPALLLLVFTLLFNYWRGRTGRSTICSTSRKRVGPRLFLTGWALLTIWFIPHYTAPFQGNETFKESKA